MKKFLFSVLIAALLLPLSLFCAEQLVFSVLITRHGDRAPFAQIEKADYNWGSAAAELTPVGMNQEFTLGTNLRKLLIEEKKLLTEEYIANSILTCASNTNRTIMSAECLLTGMYPPGTGPMFAKDTPALPDRIQVIPIRTLPDSSTMILMPYPQYLKLLEKYVYPTKKWKETEEEIKPKMEKWGQAVGYNIKTLGDVLTVGDVLICAESHNLPYPADLSQAEAQEIIDLTNNKLAYQFTVKELSYSMGGELLNAIEGNLSDFINGKQPYKLVYYSGHDITILPIMSLLGKPLETAPGYASHILIELYKNDSGSFTVKVVYNYDYQKLPVMNGSDSCSFEDFKKLVEAIDTKYKDIKTE